MAATAKDRKWTLHPALARLRTQIDLRWPNRSKTHDGTIGDAAHAARKSDHNPNSRGVVCAIDITHDPSSGCDAGKLANTLAASRDPRISYIIWNRMICNSRVQPWIWRAYAGPPHDKHMHLSVFDGEADWQIED